VLLCGSAEAALLVYEPFDYATTSALDRNGDGFSDLHRQAPGLSSLGLKSEGWFESNNATTAFDYVLSGALPGAENTAALPSSGGRRQTVLSYEVGGERKVNDGNDSYLFLEQALQPAQYPVLWFSFLVSNTAAPQARAVYDDFFGIYLRDANRGTGVGVAYDASVTNWSLFSSSGDGGVTETDLPVTVGSLHFFVGKITFGIGGADTKIDLWVDPAASPNAPTTQPFTLLTQMENLGSFEVNTYAQPNRLTEVDEIRIGTQWADVAAPEPGTAVTLCASAGLLAMRRRRRA
jgi:hypothetical protein